MRLTWHESVVKDDKLFIRWAAEEKRLRTFLCVPILVVMITIAFIVRRVIDWREEFYQTLHIGEVLTAILFLIIFGIIWSGNLWVFDKRRNAVFRYGWQKVADLSDFDHYVVKREKRDLEVVFVLIAEGKDNVERLELGVMGQRDANDIGRQLAKYTDRPCTYR